MELSSSRIEPGAVPPGVSHLSSECLYGTAEVTSRFASVANLENERGWCVSVTSNESSAGPNTIVVDREVFAGIGLDVGIRTEIGAREMRCAGRRYAYGSQPHRPIRLSVPAVARCTELRAILTECGTGAASVLLNGWSDVPFPEAIVATHAGALPDTGAAIKLIGLGNGFTPSGDDVLAGFLAAFAVFTGVVPPSLRDIPRIAFAKTTALSATTLVFASMGVTSAMLEYVLRLLTVAGAELTTAVRNYVEEVGHFSGSDTLLGVWLAIHRVHQQGVFR